MFHATFSHHVYADAVSFFLHNMAMCHIFMEKKKGDLSVQLFRANCSEVIVVRRIAETLLAAFVRLL